ncbi:MAG: hypothetical protein ACI4IL_03340 [Eubacterium sp.]
MDDFNQDFNFENQQNNQYHPQDYPYQNQYFNQNQQEYPYDYQKEERNVFKLVIAYIICLITSYIGILCWIIDTSGFSFIHVSGVFNTIFNCLTGVLLLAKHAVAIIGKVKYPKNKIATAIFVIDIVFLLIAIAVLAFFIFAFVQMCEDCG